MPAPKTYKPKVHIVIDIETLSTDKRTAIIEIGAVLAMGTESDKLSLAVKPSSFSGKPYDIDVETISWHEKIHTGYLERMEAEGDDIETAMQKFCDWIRPYAENFEVHMWSQGKDFDFPILEYALRTCGHKLPWAYSRVHCLRDLVWLNPVTRLKNRPDELPQHEALSDAMYEAMQLRATVGNSDWLRRLFK